MLYQREIVHSPRRFEQWHLSSSILKSTEFTIADIKQGGYGILDTDFWVERIRKKGFTIVVLTFSGKGRITLEDGKELILEKGDAFISGPEGQGHREETLGPEPFEHIWLMLTPSSLLLPFPSFDYKIIRFDSSALLRELIRIIIKEDLSGSNSDTMSLSLASKLFTHTVRRILKTASDGIERGHKAQMTDLWNTVSQHLENTWTVEELCRIMNCSRSHLTRLCRAYYDQSPGERVRAMKMEHAKTLLSTSTSTIHEIAESVGFSSSSLFSASFSSYEGMSPREYRKHFQEN